MPADAQAAILTALYRRLGLTIVRDVLDPGVQHAAGRPFNFAGKLADAHVAFVKQARADGLKTFFPGPVYLEDWMTADDPTAYVDWAMAMLTRWRSLGAEPPLYSPLNEPKIAKDFPPEWMHQVVLQLGARLRAAGFKTKLVIPDDENPVISIDFNGGRYNGFSLTPTYWLTGQFSRFVHPGYRSVAVSPATAGSRLVSALHGSGQARDRRDQHRVRVAASASQKLHISFAHGRFPGRVSAVRTSGTENWRSLAGGPARSSRFSAVLAPESVTTFTARAR